MTDCGGRVSTDTRCGGGFTFPPRLVGASVSLMSARYFPSIELLESRIAPAGAVNLAPASGGDVAVSSAGGKVKIVGDAELNDLKIELIAPGQLLVTGKGNTKVHTSSGAPGTSVTVLYSKDISVALGEGSDRFEIVSGVYYGSVSLDGGNGDNTFTLGQVTIPGSLTVAAKLGDDNLTINSAGADVQIGRDFTVKLGDGTADSNVSAGRLIVGGKLTISGGKDIETFQWNATDVIVGGDTTIKTGKSLDRISIQASDTLGISGKLTVVGGDSVPPGVMAIVAASFGLTAGNEMTVRGAVSITTVNGNAVSNLGGTNQTLFSSGFSVKTGKGDNSVSLIGKIQTVLGKVSITAGGATDFTMAPATSFFVSGDLLFKGGKATDSFTLDGSGTITGKLSVDLGAGAAQTATLTGPTGSGMAVLGDLILKQGEKTGTSLSKLRSVAVGGKLMVSTSGASDTLQFDNLSVFGATSIATGAGADGLSVETLGLAGQSIFGGLVKIGLGEDGDTATFGNSNVNDVVNFTLPAVLDAGPGTDSVLFTGRGNVGTLTTSNVP